MEQTQPRTFYSSIGGLIVNINNGHRITENGQSKVVGQKIAEFVPQGDGYGRLVTTDAEIIEKLDTRMGVTGDVFDAAEYSRRTTPAEIRLKQVQDEHQRLVTEHNRLLAMLGEQGKLPPKEKQPSK